MEYLLYCVTDLRALQFAEHEPARAQLGLYAVLYHGGLLLNPADVPLEIVAEGDIGCALCDISSSHGPDPQDFYWTVSCVLEAAPALPFRFPTVVRSGQLADVVLPIRKLLHENGATFRYLLDPFREVLEIDVRIVDVQELTPPATGSAYLEAARDRSRRILETAAELRTYMQGLYTDWKMHDTRDEVRCAALVERAAVAAFNERMGGYQNTRGAKVIVSRPWAPTGFRSVPELTFPRESA